MVSWCGHGLSFADLHQERRQRRDRARRRHAGVERSSPGCRLRFRGRAECRRRFASVPLDAGHDGGALYELLCRIQNDLFDVGADLCLPPPAIEKPGERLRIRPDQATHLEAAIDRLNADLVPLNSFVLPGGRPEAAWCHLAHTVCRRAERDVVALMRTESINPNVLVYLNRLSDLLFVMARVCNDNGREDVLWVPGGQK